MHNHKGKYFTYYDKRVKIDTKLAQIMSYMWGLGINTIGSCQSSCCPKCKHKHEVKTYKDGSKLYKKIKTKYCHKFAAISFYTAADAELFYNYIAEYSKDDKTMYARMNGFSQEHFTKNWHMSVFPQNYGETIKEKRVKSTMASGRKNKYEYHLVDDGCKKNNFAMTVNLWFPIEHIKYVEDRLEKAFANQKYKVVK